MQCTTPKLVREAITARVRAIQPSYPERQDVRWAAIDHPDDIAKTRLRGYYVQLEPGRPTNEVFATCRTWTARLRIWTSYIGENDVTCEGMIPQDGNDLDLMLHRATSPVVSGLFPPEYVGWDPDPASDEELKTFGAHVFTIKFLMDARLPAGADPLEVLTDYFSASTLDASWTNSDSGSLTTQIVGNALVLTLT